MLMCKVAGLSLEPSILIGDDDAEQSANLTTLSEVILMVRDNRAVSSDARAAELYHRFFAPDAPDNPRLQ